MNILFSGDRGNSQLKPPYAQADDAGLEDSADALVMEATYGDRIHADREKELEKLDTIVIDAIKN
jgi:Cft2 family RNA processing exonuclease